MALAERHRLPVIYGNQSFVRDGGLISYGNGHTRNRPPLGFICRSRPKGRKAWQVAGASANQVRVAD
jgi:hypothetical protein